MRLNECCALSRSANTGVMPRPQLFVQEEREIRESKRGNSPEHLSKTETAEKEISVQMGKKNSNQSPKPQGIHQATQMELKYRRTELLTEYVAFQFKHLWHQRTGGQQFFILNTEGKYRPVRLTTKN